ncbi:MAG: DUF5060 domain-containing protein [Planctomycetota bacterium]
MMNRITSGQKRIMAVSATLLLAVTGSVLEGAEFKQRSVKQWHPFVEWRIDDVTVGDAINPFDVVAWVVFEHDESGETIRTGMFHGGADTWKFRFTGTKVGWWSFETSCADAADLDGLSGTVKVEPNDNAVLGRGFVTSNDHEWMWSGNGRAFVPQLVMGPSIYMYYQNPGRIESGLRRWYSEHGFNGIHIGVAMRWYDIHRDRRDADADVPSGVDPRREERDSGPMEKNPNPDPRTFETLERLITASYKAGGMVHLWKWGDENRTMTPIGLVGGINGEADRRLQRYISARLGPLPGWTMGYGFDLWEWVDVDQLQVWHSHMHEQMGWPHMLGGRTHRHGTPLEDLLTDRLDYIGFETHQPDLQKYTKALELHPTKPVFMEDRFRVRDPSPYPDKDYTPEMVRQGLWRSMMAGGVANIWGYQPGATGESDAFPNREQIKTYATFHDRYFTTSMVRDEDRTNGTCLGTKDQSVLLFYWENEQSLRMDLSGMAGERDAVAVDTRKPYEEIDLGDVADDLHWQARTEGDWAVAVTTRPSQPREPRR